MAESKKIWIHYNHCKTSTHHDIVGSHEYHFSGGESGPDEWGEYSLWACAGCDTCTMQDRYSADYMIDNQGENVFETVFWPKRGFSVRPSKHFVQLPNKLQLLYRELLSAFNENLYLLCAAGLRSLVEGICAEKAIKGANLESKIEGMKVLLPESIVKNLHEFRFIGNKAVHELEAPKSYELGVAIDVIEDILNFLYALDYKASLLAQLRAAQGEADSRTGAVKQSAAEEMTSAEAAPEIT